MQILEQANDAGIAVDCRYCCQVDLSLDLTLNNLVWLAFPSWRDHQWWGPGRIICAIKPFLSEMYGAVGTAVNLNAEEAYNAVFDFNFHSGGLQSCDNAIDGYHFIWEEKCILSTETRQNTFFGEKQTMIWSALSKPDELERAGEVPGTLFQSI
jgi:hypothetical protein